MKNTKKSEKVEPKGQKKGVVKIHNFNQFTETIKEELEKFKKEFKEDISQLLIERVRPAKIVHKPKEFENNGNGHVRKGKISLKDKIKIVYLHWINPETGKVVSYQRAHTLGIDKDRNAEIGIKLPKTHKFVPIDMAKRKGLLTADMMKTRMRFANAA